MSTDQLVYRGVHYAMPQHQQFPSVEPVEHVYRGVHYRVPLKHEPQPVDETLDLHYRGHIYHHHHHQQAQRDLQEG
ncbi:DUF4278 domain-containing protein [Synechococcus sp. BSF8S]|uniref:DUF4278 domain-containing protein n=1 Tax=Synechococcales TaxID=1890424 RepID=UPI0016278E55|nr:MULTISPECIES: DUF4278 domain-containing protein [unclassified Synechococcus]MBC1260715.1 DUF4278 domain-containing protein [Synechococcus sp. BSF8S]MBC1263365.1 DUF4278 domain-containing protein [Synechococcus sp. BSA11S]